MIVLVIVSLLLASCLPVYAVPTDRVQVFDSSDLLLEGSQWKAVGVPNAASLTRVSLALHPRNWDAFLQRHAQLVDPDHESYAQWMSAEEIHALTALEATDLEYVMEYLASYGLVNQHDDTDIAYPPSSHAIIINAPVHKLEAAFETRLAIYQHAENGRQVLAMAADAHVTLPTRLHRLVSYVSGFLLPRAKSVHVRLVDGSQWKPMIADRSSKLNPIQQLKQRRHSIAAEDNNSQQNDVAATTAYYYLNSVNVIGNRYGLPDRSVVGSAIANNNVSIYEAQGQTYSTTDLAAYSQLQASSGSRSYYKTYTVIGPGTNTGTAQGEPSLDTQLLSGINPLASAYFDWIDNTSDFVLTWSQQFLASTSLPSIISISYGGPEQPGSSYASYYTSSNNNLATIAARGVTVIASSGDQGASGVYPNSRGALVDSTCQYTNAATNYNLWPSFPASSPYVLSVGATTFVTPGGELSTSSAFCNSGPTVFSNAGVTFAASTYGYPSNYGFVCPSTFASEAAVGYQNRYFGSGGGFSRYFSTPSYQSTAVSNFLTKYPSNYPANGAISYFNAGGRGYPDVSAYGDGVPVIVAGQLNFIGGTSESSPIWAAIVSEINEIAKSHGKNNVGQVAPLLYKMQAASPLTFNDITLGNNTVCPSTDAASCVVSGKSYPCKGFTTAPGWDPVTGLGSINWPNAQTWLQNYFSTCTGC